MNTVTADTGLPLAELESVGAPFGPVGLAEHEDSRHQHACGDKRHHHPPGDPLAATEAARARRDFLFLGVVARRPSGIGAGGGGFKPVSQGRRLQDRRLQDRRLKYRELWSRICGAGRLQRWRLRRRQGRGWESPPSGRPGCRWPATTAPRRSAKNPPPRIHPIPAPGGQLIRSWSGGSVGGGGGLGPRTARPRTARPRTARPGHTRPRSRRYRGSRYWGAGTGDTGYWGTGYWGTGYRGTGYRDPGAGPLGSEAYGTTSPVATALAREVGTRSGGSG